MANLIRNPMKHFFILFFISITLISIQAQEHGFVGGLSMASFKKELAYTTQIANYYPSGTGKSVLFGYQYRQSLSPKYFLDIYGLIGRRSNILKDATQSSVLNSDGIWVPSPVNTTTYSLKFDYFSLGLIASYKLWKQLHVGIGGEPTCYYSAKYPIGKTAHYIFDIPLVLQAGYSFKYFDISASYKKGNNNLMNNEEFKSLKNKDIQFSIFVPISTFLSKK